MRALLLVLLVSGCQGCVIRHRHEPVRIQPVRCYLVGGDEVMCVPADVPRCVEP